MGNDGDETAGSSQVPGDYGLDPGMDRHRCMSIIEMKKAEKGQSFVLFPLRRNI